MPTPTNVAGMADDDDDPRPPYRAAHAPSQAVHVEPVACALRTTGHRSGRRVRLHRRLRCCAGGLLHHVWVVPRVLRARAHTCRHSLAGELWVALHSFAAIAASLVFATRVGTCRVRRSTPDLASRKGRVGGDDDAVEQRVDERQGAHHIANPPVGGETHGGQEDEKQSAADVGEEETAVTAQTGLEAGEVALETEQRDREDDGIHHEEELLDAERELDHQAQRVQHHDDQRIQEVAHAEHAKHGAQIHAVDAAAPPWVRRAGTSCCTCTDTRSGGRGSLGVVSLHL
mmetsp:Transcript_9012/g.28483  ORF Transcript_9012/g.28483 Transcript_9012/m.28483 type:complete len:287 (-) Transcript_9012:27-887(-)